MAADYEYLEEIPPLYGSVVAILAWMFFHAEKVVLQLCGPSKAVEEYNQWKWRNIFVSLTHSWIASIWVFYSLFYYPEIFEDPVAYHNVCIYVQISFSLGYFIADFVDIIANGQSRQNWEVLVHHVVVLYILLYNMLVCRYVGAAVVSLGVEINSILLHTRKIMQLRHVPYDAIHYRSVLVINVITFVLFRFSAITYITYAALTHYHRMSLLYKYLLGVMIVLTWIVNIGLFHRIIKCDFMRRYRPAADKTSTGKTSTDKPAVIKEIKEHHVYSNGFVNNNGLQKRNNKKAIS